MQKDVRGTLQERVDTGLIRIAGGEGLAVRLRIGRWHARVAHLE
jgi:hypothetical protein